MIKLYLSLFVCVLLSSTLQAQVGESKKNNTRIDDTKDTLIKKDKALPGINNKEENTTNSIYKQIKNLDYSSGKYVYFQVIVPELKAIKKYQEDHIT